MKTDNIQLSEEEIKSIKDSFFHIYHSLISEGFLSKAFIGILFKWAIQLHITEDELKHIDPSYEEEEITNSEDALSHLYNLVFMVYLDGIVEDIELVVVTKYAEKIGFEAHIVNDLLKAIVTAPYDGFNYKQVKDNLREIIEDSKY